MGVVSNSNRIHTTFTFLESLSLLEVQAPLSFHAKRWLRERRDRINRALPRRSSTVGDGVGWRVGSGRSASQCNRCIGSHLS
jgi:hypothetical protein